MRICHAIESGATGALEMVLLTAEIQRGEGHSVLIVYSERPGTPTDLRARVHPQVGLKHLRMRPLLPFLPVWCGTFASVLRSWKPDVLHLHCSRAGLLGRLVAGSGFGGRVFYSPHCIPLMYLDLSTFERGLCRALERLAQFACPAVYLACARPEQATIARRLSVPVRLLENAVEDGLVASRSSNATRTGNLRGVVTCARIAELKDPRMFAEICRAVQVTRPDIEFEWIGDGDRRQRRLLERAGVQVTGWLTRDEALRRVAAASIYLSTSAWEGMPVSVLEAMFLGVPVLCRRAEWSMAIIGDGETGRLFDDVGAARDALLAPDVSWRMEAAEAARTAARERFSRARYAADLADAYRDGS